MLTIADLALFTPIGAVYHQVRSAECSWSSVHPGWRFCKALELVAAEDWWTTGLYAAEDLDDRICDRLGWPHPRQMLEFGAKLSGPTLERHRRACEIRLADFMAFYRRDRIFDYEMPVGKFLTDHMPTVYYPGTGTVCNVRVGSNAEAFEQLKRCILVRRYVEAMLRPIQKSVLPPGCQFELYFADVWTESDIVEVMARESPWLDPARFGHHRVN